jgi:nucleoside-diphosphate-sugar epimerase
VSGAAAPPPRPAPGLCLLTGASGFIGGRLAARMAAQGRAVRCLARAGSDVSALEALGLPVARGDLGDPPSLHAAVAGCEAVVHCAAIVSDWGTVAEIRAANVAGTSNLLDAASRAGVRRFVHLSTTDVYGHPATLAVDERREPAAFANWYAQTKREAEQLVRRAAGSGIETVVLRPATVYGPGSKDVIGEIAKAIRGGHMLLIARGRSIAGLCFVENVVDAVLLAVDEPRAAGHVFNVSDELEVSWWRFTADLAAGLGCRPPRLSLPYAPAAALARLLESGYRLGRRLTGLTLPPLLSRQALQVLGRDQSFSAAALRQTLAWQPRVGYDEGLAATLAWLAAEP